MASGTPEIRWSGDAVERQIEQTMHRRVRQAAVMVETEVKRNISTPSRAAGPAGPGEFPHADTGRLRNSIFHKMTGKLSAIVGTNLLYGLFLEVGAFITPKAAKALSIPISRKAKRHAGSPRDFPVELDLQPRKGRPPLLVERQGKKTIIHYVLVKEVNLEPRPYLEPTLVQNQERIREILTAPIKGKDG